MARSPQVDTLARCLAACIVVATGSYARSAQAADAQTRVPTQAEILFEQGRQAATAGNYGLACQSFKDSLRYEAAVGTLINIGDCEEHLGHPSSALEFYEKAFARLSVTDDRMPLVQERIASLEKRSSRLEIRIGDGAPAETKVTLDGEVLTPKSLSTAIILPTGNHVVVATAVGFRGSRQGITLHEGEARAVKVWPGPPLEAAVPTYVDTPPDAAREASEGKARTLRIVGIGAIGLGVASLWVGSVTGLFAIDRESLRHDNCDASNACNRTGLDAAQSGSTFATVSTITLAAGAAFTIAGIYLFVANPPAGVGPGGGSSGVRATALAPFVVPTGASGHGTASGVLLRRSF